jgi:rhamnosyltransferase
MSDAIHQSVSVVIPVLNAEAYLDRLLAAIFAQRPVAPQEVVLVDSMSKDRTREIAAKFERVRIVPVEKFTHGGARNLGAREAKGEIIVLMTQDAVPQDPAWLANLLAPFSDPKVAATYSRQVPYPDANPMERYFLHTHFPPGNAVRREQHEGDHGLGDVFFSNVAAALRRELLLKFPFDEKIIMSEDQQVSRDLLKAGYAVVYQPRSVVIHSHNYSLSVCFRRYFDSVYSLTQIFPKHDMGESATMGFSYLFREAWHMARHYPSWLPFYFCYSACKAGGTLMGHFAEKLPRTWARKMSLHRYYWDSPPPA